MTSKWQYALTSVSPKGNLDEIVELMSQMGESGWELVNGCVTGVSTALGGMTNYLLYTLYWRKPVDSVQPGNVENN